MALGSLQCLLLPCSSLRGTCLLPAVTVAALATGILDLTPTTESSVVSPGGGCGGREAGTLRLELARRALEFAGVVVRGVGFSSAGRGETSTRTWLSFEASHGASASIETNTPSSTVGLLFGRWKLRLRVEASRSRLAGSRRGS